MKKLFTLGDLKEALEGCKPDDQVYFDFPEARPTEFASWRGDYSEVALGFEVGYGGNPTTVKELLEKIEKALKSEFEGWKGGTYSYDHDSSLWVNNRGCCNNVRICGIETNGIWVKLLTIEAEY